eukprot:GFUD01017885.1.p1 GENE.GFUD01017885.1~~GFUD01017885.1.p1  ORF type:complete len:340 (+),score=124.17 GFUD01017885.1:53-1072(+)
MCIYFNPKIDEISEKELENAGQAAVDYEDENEEDEEEEEYISDEDSMTEEEEEVCLGLNSLNKILSLLGEDELLERTWSQLCVVKKLKVIDIIINLDLIMEMEDISEKGKEAMTHVRAIFEGKSDEIFECDGKCSGCDHEDEEGNEEYFSNVDSKSVSQEEVETLNDFNRLISMLGEDEILEETWAQLSDVKKQEVVDIICHLDLETEMEDVSVSEKGKEAMAHVRAILERKSERSFEFDGNVRVFDQAAVDHEEMKYLKGFQRISSIVGVDELMLEETWSQLCVIKKKEVFDIILSLNLEIDIKDMSEEMKEAIALAVACVRAIIEGMSAGITSEEPF